jgi:hypothetical protein
MVDSINNNLDKLIKALHDYDNGYEDDSKVE